MERNKYYASLGIKDIDIKSTVEATLQETPINMNKLIKLSQTVKIPHRYRTVLWKIMLDYYPPNTKKWPITISEKQNEFELIQSTTAAITKDLNMLSEDLTAERMVRMLMLAESSGSPFATLDAILQIPLYLLQIASTFLSICDDLEDEDVFWIFASFIRKFKIPMHHYEPDLKLFDQMFKNNQLAGHFEKYQIDIQDLIKPWYRSYFASVLSPTILER